MLKNGEIIERLSEDQKLALATDIGAAANDAINALGVPRIRVSDIDAINRACGGLYPAMGALANSWNAKLIEEAVGDIMKSVGAEQYNLVCTPPVQAICSPYATGLTEDPYLNARIASACVSAIENNDAAACVDGYYVRPSDLEYLDAKPDMRVVGNAITRPAEIILRSKRAKAVRLSYVRLKGEWRELNAKLVSSALNGGNVRNAVCTEAYEEALRSGLSVPQLTFLGAPTTAIRAAIKNFRRMKDDVERGSVSVEELQNALASGTAVSEYALDVAVDKVIELAKAVSNERGKTSTAAAQTDENGAPVSAPEDLNAKYRSLLAIEESSVLLKNNGVLPLREKVKIACVGEIFKTFKDGNMIAAHLCASNNAVYDGYADGYRLASDRSDELIPEALRIASNADVVLAFVGLGEQRERKLSESKSLKLPANQLALIDAILKKGKKVVAVIVGDVLPDTDFDEKSAATLFVPLGGARAAESVFGILFGAVNPSGKLAVSSYGNTDEYFAKQRSLVLTGRFKVGEFVGYKRYTSEGTKVKYPFGHGLSYTRFEYSNIIVNSDAVQVTVRNVGTVAACETAQMYIGKKDSAIVRPLRELKGFAKILIAPGAAVQIKFPINPSMLETLDESDGTRKKEGGKYEVYIGASSQDIRLTGELNVAGVQLTNVRGDRLSDYLPTVTNIVSDGFKMNTVVANDSERGDFRSARPSEGFAFEQLFADEFGPDDKEEEKPVEVETEEDSILSYLDDSMTVNSIVDGLTAFALTKGYKLENTAARDIVSALAASRVVLTRCDGEAFSKLAEILSEYLNCPTFLDDATDYETSDDLFMHGGVTHLTEAVEFAANSRTTATLAVIDNMAADKIGSVFVPFIRYATAPDNITVSVGASKRKIDVPTNVWFLIRLEDGRKKFPGYLAEMASVVIPKIAAAKSAVDSDVIKPDYYRFCAACQRAERDYELEEPLWKKVDALERFAAARIQFAIGNKIWVQMEKYLAVQLSCGAEPTAALDSAVAAKLIPYLTLALAGKSMPDDVDFVQTLENIFGEDEVAHIKAAVKAAKS